MIYVPYVDCGIVAAINLSATGSEDVLDVHNRAISILNAQTIPTADPANIRATPQDLHVAQQIGHILRKNCKPETTTGKCRLQQGGTR